MKDSLQNIKIFLIIFFIFNLSAVAQINWVQLDKPTIKNLKRAAFVDSSRGWVVGDEGTILRTTDGGQSWVLQNSQVTDNILDIYMLNNRLGWALAHVLPAGKNEDFGTMLLKTTNGGNAWTNEMFLEPETFFFSIVFLDSLNGWMCGQSGKIVGTVDGGENWFDARVESPIYPRFPIRRIKFFSQLYGHVVGGLRDMGAVVWRTTNGGESWSFAQLGSEPLYDIHYFDSLNIMCVGGDFDFGAAVVHTTDGGANWDYSFINIYGEGRGVSFRTQSEGCVALGFSGSYMVTTDAGQTWQDVYTPDTSAVYDVVFTDRRNGFMFGSNGMILKYAYTHPLTVSQGWNLLSLPASVTNNLKQNLFPSATSEAFTFTDSGYKIKDTILNGIGYWLNFPSNQVIELSGSPRIADSIAVRIGWNMIGSITNPIAVASIKSHPPDIVISDYYAYESVYTIADTIKPGHGYWVKTSANGKLILNSIK